MPKKKDKKDASERQDITMDDLAKTVMTISINRKQEIEENEELAALICGLADYGGELMRGILNESISTDDDEVKRKDMLLVIQLMYMKLCSDILERDGKINLTDSIPTSGFTGVTPIDFKKQNVPIYL